MQKTTFEQYGKCTLRTVDGIFSFVNLKFRFRVYVYLSKF